jgi:hypothetical protein
LGFGLFTRLTLKNQETKRGLKMLGIDTIWAKLIGIVGTLLAMFVALKLSNKKAADIREAEIKLEDAQEELKDLEEAKKIEKSIDSFSDDDKRRRLREFFKEDE